MKLPVAALMVSLAASAVATAQDDAPLKIGVLAYRPKPLILEQWQPVATYLESALGRRVELATYDQAELRDAASRRAVDVVITTATHFVLLQQTTGLSAPLATTVSREGPNELATYGGAILARADRDDLTSLADLSGKRFAATTLDAFGGYQMQAVELLEAGLPLPRRDHLLLTGQPHDRVVEAVLDGRADVGFVRAGVLESLVRQGKLEAARVKLINRQALPAFPFAASTRLYPEWPVAMMPQIDQRLAARVAAALFLMPRDRPEDAGIAGFTTPANYNGVEHLMRLLRLPPFDQTPEITLADLWRRYALWISTLAGLLLLLAAALFGLVVMYRRSRESLHELARQAEKENLILAGLSEGVYGVDTQGKCIFVNPRALALLGFGESEVLGREAHHLFLGQAGAEGAPTTGPVTLTLHDGAKREVEDTFVRRDRTTFPVSLGVAAMRHGKAIVGAVIVFQDITDRRRNDAVNTSRLHLAQFSLTHSLDELLEETLNEVEKLTGSLIGFWHFVEDDQEALTLQAWSTRTKAEFCKAVGQGLHYAISEAGVWTDCIRQRKAVIHNDYASLPHRKGMPEGHAEVIRELVVPVLRGEKVAAILGVGNKPTEYDEKDVAVVSLIADLAWETAERTRAEDTQRRLNRELRAIRDCNQLLMRAADEETLLRDVCRVICEQAGYRVAWVGYAEPDEATAARPVAWAGVDDGTLASGRMAWPDTEHGPEPFSTAVRSGKSTWIQDFATDPKAAAWRERTSQRGYRSCIALPLKEQHARVFGALCIYASEANAFTAEEIRLLEELAGDLALGITLLRARVGLDRAEEERQANLRFFECMDRVNRAISGTRDLEAMMSDVLDLVLSVFECDRAFLAFPCDPEALAWRVPVERNRPEYPGIRALTPEVPMGPDDAQVLRRLLASDKPLKFGPGATHPLPAETSERYGIKCFMAMAIHPKGGKPWQFGIHQCSFVRVWTAEEERLFQEIGRRLADGLTTLLAHRDLQDSQGKLEEAQRIAHIGYWDRDLAAKRVTLSDESCRIFGLAPRELHLSLDEWHERWLALIHPEDRDRTGAAVADALRRDVPYNVDYRVIRPDGGVRFIHSEATVTWDESGHPRRMLGMMQDTTERKLAEEEVHRLNQELEQRVATRTSELQAANRELETFTYSVSHDLRQPLRSIDGFVALLKKRLGTTLDDESRRYMATISEAVLRMARLIDGLLSFSRSGRFEMTRAPVDLGSLVKEVVRELGRATTGRVVEWRTGDLPVVTGDRAMLRLVVGNLLSNALKFTEPRERAEIEIGCLPGEEAEAIIFVRDNGVGFDMQYAKKLFGVFERLHGVDEFKGAGIGLANVRRVISRHGGRTWAEGKVDGGATFYFSLPRQVKKAQ